MELDNKVVTQTEEFVKSLPVIVRTNEEMELAANSAKIVKSKYKEIDTMRKEMTKPLDDSKKKIMEFFRKPLDLLGDAEAILKKAMIAYQMEQDRKAREQQEKLRLEALKKEDALRQKLAAKAEKQEAKGNTEVADELRQQAETVAVDVPVVVSSAPKIPGQSMKTIWKHRIADESLIPRSFLMADNTKLGKHATNMKDTLPVPGVVFYSEQSMSVRTL